MYYKTDGSGSVNAKKFDEHEKYLEGFRAKSNNNKPIRSSSWSGGGWTRPPYSGGRGRRNRSNGMTITIVSILFIAVFGVALYYLLSGDDNSSVNYRSKRNYNDLM